MDSTASTTTTAKSETKYERLRKIGIGSYGVVFKCVNRQTGQIVAIKRYSENDTDPIIRKIAMREVRMLRQLKHPNLIHLIEVFRRKRILHLVFDYCELTVLDVIEKYANNCPLNLIRKIIWQLVNGVSHCHAHNCIHRDIKPENILINQSGVVKLCDFGFARNLKSSGRLNSTTGNGSLSLATADKQIKYEREAQLLGVSTNQLAQFMQATGTGSSLSGSSGGSGKASVAGAGGSGQLDNDKENNELMSERQALTEYVATRWYRAPELLVGDVFYDKKIDIWAIGCVTAELMRGEPIWPGKTDLDQLCMIRNSLGPLTSSQTHTLLTQALYDQASIERLLAQQANSPTEPLERKLPARVGQPGMEFVYDCLRIDPIGRPTCDELLQHHYIQSAQMTQFVRSATALVSPVAEVQAQRNRTLESGAIVRETRGVQTSTTTRTNSQAILSIANGNRAIAQPANKRLVLAGIDNFSTSPPIASSSKTTPTRHSGSLVPVPVRNSRQSASTRTSTSTTSSGGLPGAAAAAVAQPKRKVPPASGQSVVVGPLSKGFGAASKPAKEYSSSPSRRSHRVTQSNSSLVKSSILTPPHQRASSNSRRPSDDSTARRDRVQTNLGHHNHQQQQQRTKQTSSSTSFLPSVKQATNLRV